MSFPGGDKNIKPAKITNTAVEEGPEGDLQGFGYSCISFMAEGNQLLYLFDIMISKDPKPIATYAVDKEAQVYPNILNQETKEPALVNGGGIEADLSKDLLREDPGSGTRSIVGENKYMTLGPLDMDFHPYEKILGFSFVLTLKITQFQLNSDGQIILASFLSDKRVDLEISFVGVLRLKLTDDASVTLAVAEEANGNEDMALNVYLGRIRNSNIGLASIYYWDSFGQHGNAASFSCNFFNSHLNFRGPTPG